MAEGNLANLQIDKDKYSPKHRGKRRRRILYVLVLVVLLFGAGLYATGIVRPARQVDVVRVSRIFPSQTYTLLNASGYVVAQRKAAVASKVTGRLIELYVEEGSNVKAGEVIARLENKDVLASEKRAQANVEVARFNLQQARAELKDARQRFERQKELVKQEIISQSEYDTTEAAFSSAQAAVEAAEAALASSRAALAEAAVSVDYTSIRAPFDAVVLTKNADIGDIVTPIGAAADAQASVVTIADMDSLQVEADVSESNIGLVTVGQPCTIQLDAIPGKRFAGKVHMIVPTAERSKASVLVKVAFVETSSRILPEMSAKVSFLEREVAADERDPVLLVPTSVVREHNGQETVLAVEDGRAFVRDVETGREYKDRVEIVSGLEGGENLVLEPSPDLRDQTRVKTSLEE